MTGITLKATHQNPDHYKEMEEAFGIKDTDVDRALKCGGYRAVYIGRCNNNGKLYIGIKGNRHCVLAQLDEATCNCFAQLISSAYQKI